MSKITPYLWFENDTSDSVAKHYQTIFGEAAVQIISESQAMTTVKIFDEELILVNFDKHDLFNDAVSFVVTCKDQTEIDLYWNAILENGGEASQCGWCRDTFGVRWQIIPEHMGSLIATPEARDAMTKMQKIVIADLETANS